MKSKHIDLLTRQRALLLDQWLSEPQSRPKILAKIMEIEEEIALHTENAGYSK